MFFELFDVKVEVGNQLHAHFGAHGHGQLPQHLQGHAHGHQRLLLAHQGQITVLEQK